MAGRAAKPEHQEVRSRSSAPGRSSWGYIEPEDVVAGRLRVERSHQSSKTSFANRFVNVALGHPQDHTVLTRSQLHRNNPRDRVELLSTCGGISIVNAAAAPLDPFAIEMLTASMGGAIRAVLEAGASPAMVRNLRLHLVVLCQAYGVAGAQVGTRRERVPGTRDDGCGVKYHTAFRGDYLMNRSMGFAAALILVATSVGIAQQKRVVTTADYDRAVKMLAPSSERPGGGRHRECHVAARRPLLVHPDDR